MVLKVQCDKCLTRYKLNESRIKGKGARITCPKCGNQFVVYRNQEPDPALDDEPATIVADRDTLFPPGITPGERPPGRANLSADPFAGLPPQTRKPTEADLFDDEYGDDEATIVAPAMGLNFPAQASHAAVFSPPTPRDAAPAIPEPEPPVAAPVSPGVERPKFAEELDWREVGLTAFKVKVSFGLVYDFSDVITLKKYLSDKKVALTDNLSMDGKTWKPIGELGNLDNYFIDRWVELKEAQLSSGVDLKPPIASSQIESAATPSGSDPFSVGKESSASPFTESKKMALGAALFDEVQESAKPIPPPRRSSTPVRAPSKPPKSPVTRVKPKGASTSSSRGVLLPMLLAGVAVYLGWSVYSGALASQFSAEEAIDRSAHAKALYKQALPYFPVALNAVVVPVEAEAPSVDTPVDEQAVPEVEAAEAVKEPAKKERVKASKPKARKASGGGKVEVSSISPELLIELGDSKFRSKDYAAAIVSYEKAVKMQPKRGLYQVKLGRAHHMSGAHQNAVASYKRAVQLDRSQVDALKWSGECYEKLGQKSEAIGAYQAYLNAKTSASDRAEIEARIAKLS